ncbi:MAG: ABC transporter ATP-binding protein, partial [Ignavibacteria bacterium]|nr:ABC transporter ATP-binding protein [Ignavibacteria bacterium]
LTAADGISFSVYEGEILGIAGESGSGKTVTAYSILRLIPDPPGKIEGGEIIFDGIDLLKLSKEEMAIYRGSEIAMIFQEPSSSLNPLLKAGMQVSEVIRAHFNLSKDESYKKALELLRETGIPEPEKRMNEYPYSLSGGMQQRIMIAIALACNPKLLIADEPTTSLDATIQMQILQLLKNIKSERTNASIILISHNLAMLSEICDRVIIMYAGKICEIADKKTIFTAPKHPYTRGLLSSLPLIDGRRKERLNAIGGSVPDMLNLPQGCRFCTRCPDKFERCESSEPELIGISEEHYVSCHLYEK